MCTYQTEKLAVNGSGKGPAGWFSLSSATVYFDHPVHYSGRAQREHRFSQSRQRRPFPSSGGARPHLGAGESARVQSGKRFKLCPSTDRRNPWLTVRPGASPSTSRTERFVDGVASSGPGFAVGQPVALSETMGHVGLQPEKREPRESLADGSQ